MDKYSPTDCFYEANASRHLTHQSHSFQPNPTNRLRPEATTRLFELGLNVIEVSTITGHKDLTMLNRYTHLKAEKLSEKLWKLDGEKSECANRSQERF